VTGKRFADSIVVKSTRKETVELHANYEEADTRLIVCSCEAVTEDYEKLLVMSNDTNVLLFRLDFMPSRATEV